MAKEETNCVKNCVKALHKTHIRVFDHLLDFETRQANEDQRLADILARETAKELKVEAERKRE